MYHILWLAAMVVFIIAEWATYQLISIWMAVGSLGALIAYFLGADIVVQFVTFVVVSVIMIAFTRPFFKKVLHTKNEKTNVDRVIGKEAIVTNRIENLKNAGTVKIGGMDWSAKSESDEPVDEGTLVEVLRVEGVKVIVRRKG